MRKSTLLYFLTLTMFFAGHAQSRAVSDGSYRSISLYDWTNADKFKTGPLPLIQGQGILSDSLSEAYNGITFYELNDEYFAIKNWGDYYYWFTQKFPELFRQPVLEYEYYWLVNDPIGMVRFISSCENYQVDFYPTLFSIEFASNSNPDDCRRLASIDDVALNDKDVKQFHRSLNNRQNREPVNQGYAESALSGDLDQMREYVRANRVSGNSSATTGTGSSGPARIKN